VGTTASDAPGENRHRRPRLLPTIKQAAIAFGIALALLVINDSFVFESIVVPTSSMQPTILPNERIILNHLSRTSLNRFDVVVINEGNTGRRIVKRIIGLPGERVRLEDSWKVFLNGQPLPYGQRSTEGLRTEGGDHVIRIVGDLRPPETKFGKKDLLLGPDEYFVLGDNRFASSDSRVVGPVKRDHIQGTVSGVWYSFDLVLHRFRTERIAQRIR